MRKILLGLLTILLLALSVYTVIFGITIGKFQIKGVKAIQQENAKLESKIETANKLKNTEYPSNVTTLENSYKKLMAEKENYEQILELGVDENGEPISKIQEYEIEKIWVAMGNYAKKQGVDLKLDITANNAISKTYDLKFSATGGYIPIIDFLYDVERDSTLVFKLEDFKMAPIEGNNNKLVATFTCKDVKVNISEINGLNTETEDKEQKTDENKDTTSNTTNNNTNETNKTTDDTNKTNTTKDDTNKTNTTTDSTTNN